MSFLDSLVSGVSRVGDFVGSLDPLLSTGLQVADALGAFGSNETQRRAPPSRPIGTQYASTLPVPAGRTVPVPRLPGGTMAAPAPIAIGAGAGVLSTALSDYLPDIGVPGPGVFSPGQVGCITPTVVAQHLRLPTHFSFPHPTSGNMVTYVKAVSHGWTRPRPKAHKRRCSGGR